MESNLKWRTCLLLSLRSTRSPIVSQMRWMLLPGSTPPCLTTFARCSGSLQANWSASARPIARRPAPRNEPLSMRRKKAAIALPALASANLSPVLAITMSKPPSQAPKNPSRQSRKPKTGRRQSRLAFHIKAGSSLNCLCMRGRSAEKPDQNLLPGLTLLHRKGRFLGLRHIRFPGGTAHIFKALRCLVRLQQARAPQAVLLRRATPPSIPHARDQSAPF